MKQSSKIRRIAFGRDRGVCAHCAADCEKTKRVYFAILDSDAQWFYGDLIGYQEKVFWEADHILERAVGGPDDIDNLQTLCIQCHRSKTAKFMALRGIIPVHASCPKDCFNEEHANDLLCYSLEYMKNGMYFENIESRGPNTKVLINVLKERADEFEHRLARGFKAHIKMIVTMQMEITARETLHFEDFVC